MHRLEFNHFMYYMNTAKKILLYNFMKWKYIYDSSEQLKILTRAVLHRWIFFPTTISTSIAITSHRFYLIKENLSRCLQRILKVFESSKGLTWMKFLSNPHLISNHYPIFKHLKEAQWKRFSCNLHVSEVFSIEILSNERHSW